MTPTELTRQDNFRAGEIPDRLPEGGVKGSGKGQKGQKGADNNSHPRAGDNALFKRNECKFFLQGKCTKGDKCEYFHNPDDRDDCPYWPGDVVQLWYNEELDKARRERGRPKVKAAAPALARGGRSTSSQARSVAFPSDPDAMEEEITNVEVKIEDDAIMETGVQSPRSQDDNPHSRQTSQDSVPPDYGEEGKLTPERDQRDTLEEQAEEQLKGIINIPDA